LRRIGSDGSSSKADYAFGVAKPLAYVCQGSKCSRACAHDELLRSLTKVADVRLVRCQKICHGSVVAVGLGRHLEWFERIDSVKAGVALKQAIHRGKRGDVSPRLKKRRIKKRSDRAPR
jgi:hypothetical protein